MFFLWLWEINFTCGRGRTFIYFMVGIFGKISSAVCVYVYICIWGLYGDVGETMAFHLYFSHYFLYHQWQSLLVSIFKRKLLRQFHIFLTCVETGGENDFFPKYEVCFNPLPCKSQFTDAVSWCMWVYLYEFFSFWYMFILLYYWNIELVLRSLLLEQPW